MTCCNSCNGAHGGGVFVDGWCTTYDRGAWQDCASHMGPSYAIAMLLFGRIRREKAGEYLFLKLLYMQMT